MTAAAATPVLVRYWAAARAATGVDEETLEGATVADVLAAARAAHPGLQPVLGVASILVAGVASGPERTLAAGETVEVLPPFAGG
ncbi:MoaD/ThiS family protein [Luteipulveratus sp. YIM 133132]|uniref:MoaD/ThiS family protein n=1 Tax=Luteipulveratus flavus TaxID=3031728 RepID=A0ABT6CB16_9MICO|nr:MULTISPECIES: MoaD/ThiS family protein [unclassified Luteipulveratus]MDE9365523.1 MoaD/ThiS family protein [Luteipulveratus sp. YIM 133132]MDF8265562.1 MoaD/ThiS family protein [Luteipulveratus sp. YIM 133296]